MTMSYQFSVKGLHAPYSTDISDGSKSAVFPPKHSYWGHGILAKEFDTTIFIRNKSHNPKKTNHCKGRLRIYSNTIKKVFNISIKAESIESISLSKLLKIKKKPDANKAQFISWFIETDQPTCDTFWVCHNEKNGSIMGDHGF